MEVPRSPGRLARLAAAGPGVLSPGPPARTFRPRTLRARTLRARVPALLPLPAYPSAGPGSAVLGAPAGPASRSRTWRNRASRSA